MSLTVQRSREEHLHVELECRHRSRVAAERDEQDPRGDVVDHNHLVLARADALRRVELQRRDGTLVPLQFAQEQLVLRVPDYDGAPRVSAALFDFCLYVFKSLRILPS